MFSPPLVKSLFQLTFSPAYPFTVLDALFNLTQFFQRGIKIIIVGITLYEYGGDFQAVRIDKLFFCLDFVLGDSA